MKISTRRTAPIALPLLATAALLALTGAGRTIAAPHAASGHPAAQLLKAGNDHEEKEGDEADEKEGEEKEDGDEDEAPKVKADITPQAAQAAALKARPGKVGEVELESEQGKAVYSIDITAADGQKYEVTVDGHDGRVLSNAVDKEDDEHEGDDKDDKADEADGK